MINKLKPRLDRYDVCITSDEAAKVFKVLLSVSNMLDSGWFSDGIGNIIVKAEEFVAVKKDWDEMVSVEDVEE